MTETAARPWWADVQHLRPREDREATPAPAAPSSWAGDSAVALLDLPPVDDALAAVDRPLPIDFDVDDVDWTPTKRPARDVIDDLDWSPAKRFARAAADLADGRNGRFDRDGERTGHMTMPPRAAAATPAPATLPDFADDAFTTETGRRTISIRGQVDDRATAPAAGQAAGGRRYRQRATAAERIAGRPDRIALWAVILGVVLILVAAFSAPGAEAAILGA